MLWSREVRLTSTEWKIARYIGLERHVEAIRQNKHDRYGCESGLSGHILGCAGEMAAAKVLGIYWEPRVNVFSEADLGEDIQVRTRSRHDYDLLVRPKDKDHHAFVHVTCEPPETAPLRVCGWLWGREAKHPAFFWNFNARPPVYFVPHDLLRPIGLTRH